MRTNRIVYPEGMDDPTALLSLPVVRLGATTFTLGEVLAAAVALALLLVIMLTIALWRSGRARALGCLHGSQRAGPARAPQDNRQHDDEKQRQPDGRRQRLSQRERGGAEANDGERKQCGRIIHPFRIDDSIGSHKTKT